MIIGKNKHVKDQFNEFNLFSVQRWQFLWKSYSTKYTSFFTWWSVQCLSTEAINLTYCTSFETRCLHPIQTEFSP